MVPWIPIAMMATTFLDALLSNKSYPPELEKLLGLVTRRGNDLAGTPGFSPMEIEALFGKNYENVRGQGKNLREQTTSTLSNMGMSGTGTAVKAAQQNAWANENMVTEAIRDMVIANKQQKNQDISLAAQIAQGGVGAEVNRVEKGPQLTDILALYMMMGGDGGGKQKELPTTNVVNPFVDSMGILGAYNNPKALSSLPTYDPISVVSDMFDMTWPSITQNQPGGFSLAQRFGW